MFARAIRGKIESLLPSGFARWTATAARWRGAVQASGLSLAGRRKFWERFTARAFANPDSEPGQDGFARFVAAAMDEAGAVEHGPVTRVEVDGNDPEFADAARDPRVALSRRRPVRWANLTGDPRFRPP